MFNSSRNQASCPIENAAQKYSDAIAFIAEERKISYHDLNQAIDACCINLQSQGAKPDDRIVFYSASSLEHCILFWAIVRLGAVACPVNPALPSENREKNIALLQPQWIANCEERAVGFASLHPPYGPNQGTSFQESRTRKNCPCCTIVMTSGSSGVPRAAVHSQKNHLQAALAANRNMPLVPGDCWLLSLPLFHVSGIAILFRCALAGAAAAIQQKETPLETALAQSQATHVSLVPTQLYRLLESPAGCEVLRTMKGVLLGGAPAVSTLIQRAVDMGVPLVCSYGMTETAAQLCATPLDAPLETLLTSGYPLMPGTLRIGTGNMIEVRGPALFQGYLTKNTDMELPLTEDGWFRTGDIGYLDDAGRLHVSGRADAMFISSGENIQPEEIEAALCTLPSVQRAIVVPVPHEEYGMTPAAFIEVKDGMELDEMILKNGLEEQLPRFKIPRRFFPWPQELSTGMKVDRKALAKMVKPFHS